MFRGVGKRNDIPVKLSIVIYGIEQLVNFGLKPSLVVVAFQKLGTNAHKSRMDTLGDQSGISSVELANIVFVVPSEHLVPSIPGEGNGNTLPGFF